jgi:hypothetical protein
MFRQNAGIETAPLQQESILFHPGQNRFCVLNSTSSFIWNRLATPVSPEELAEDLSARFDEVTGVEALEDVRRALDELLALDLVCRVADPVA